MFGPESDLEAMVTICCQFRHYSHVKGAQQVVSRRGATVALAGGHAEKSVQHSRLCNEASWRLVPCSRCYVWPLQRLLYSLGLHVQLLSFSQMDSTSSVVQQSWAEVLQHEILEVALRVQLEAILKNVVEPMIK
eukprot:2278340-Amphidinium_carterae.2